ncbi:hypothetical protein ACJX0J_009273 [Zea mays]
MSRILDGESIRSNILRMMMIGVELDSKPFWVGDVKKYYTHSLMFDIMAGDKPIKKFHINKECNTLVILLWLDHIVEEQYVQYSYMHPHPYCLKYQIYELFAAIIQEIIWKIAGTIRYYKNNRLKHYWILHRLLTASITT